ncbi:hypothetical protein M9H77_07493 [Catharanthus roseus]|uniref:Uncharacterized protein n=1 Tax=Catharanthus roseus TaxID=4058 RepID=A0ACC0BVG9_CATRO|nr:hypothetical protein M9H77_07493 [Catharanthus roseus]
MDYNWSNPSWKRMETNSKQEDYQSKLARDMHNFHHDGGNGFNVYGWNNHGNGNFTLRRQVGGGNFSFYVKSSEHTSYDDNGCYARVNPRYDNYKYSPYECHEKIVFRVLSLHVSIYGDFCAISFGGDVFLVVPYVSKCLSSHVSLEDPLMSSGIKFDHSCYGFGFNAINMHGMRTTEENMKNTMKALIVVPILM